tara:strand:- start:481 stop:1140 length:660 start_codon:yes stop_codon:yes gene_type:complete
MSKTITHDGQEYILKTEVDGIVRERLSKVAEGKRAAEKQVSDLKKSIEALEVKAKSNEALSTQIAQLQDELSLSNQKYDRHQAIANHGITDPEVRDLIEWQYNKSMDGKPKKDKVSLSDWMSQMKENQQVPKVLQPFFENPEPQAQAQAEPQAQAQATQAEPQAQAVRPSTNNGVNATNDYSTNQDLWKRAGDDFEFYQKNREQLKKSYYKQRASRFKI